MKREGESSSTSSEHQDWRASLSVNLPVLGVIEAELFLRGQKVSVVIYSEDESTAKLMDGQLDRLKNGLESRGLDVSVLLCRQGSRVQEKSSVRLTKCVDEQV